MAAETVLAEDSCCVEFRDVRGYAMRHGHCARLSCLGSCGRANFARRAGGHRDVLRCSNCKPGRHHGDGGAKATKKVRGSSSRGPWLQLCEEVRNAEKAFGRGIFDDELFSLAPSLSD
eukprot:NODE_25037_length_601_cov_18.569620.p1 GENE.NODE_25037_length_601_cov_18.569620~~NODE_25037_length_601_cov_18.569620.p1  ORF type:complete len:118 (-),score=19.13 NODE_25037_length_601_cov_18.569620:172-525(-)